MKCYSCNEKFVSLRDSLGHHFEHHVDLPMKIWAVEESDGKHRHKARTYSFVIPQNIIASGKSASVDDLNNVIICSTSTTTPSKVVKKPVSVDSPVKPQVNDSGNSIEDMDFEVDASE